MDILGDLLQERIRGFIVDIFAEIHRRIPNSVLLLVGGGDNAAENRYKEKVKKELKVSLEGAVVFAGVRTTFTE